jgi:predicted DNA-binding protein
MDVWVSLPEDLGQRLRRVTEPAGWSQTLFIRTALRDYLDGVEAILASDNATVPVDIAR